MSKIKNQKFKSMINQEFLLLGLLLLSDMIHFFSAGFCLDFCLWSFWFSFLKSHIEKSGEHNGIDVFGVEFETDAKFPETSPKILIFELRLCFGLWLASQILLFLGLCFLVLLNKEFGQHACWVLFGLLFRQSFLLVEKLRVLDCHSSSLFFVVFLLFWMIKVLRAELLENNQLAVLG